MTVTTDLAVPVRECAQWCEDGPDTHATQHPDDRSCWSTYQVIPLSRHRAQKMDDGTYLRAFLNVYLRRPVREDESLVYIHSEETDAELLLTLPAPRELHRVLGSLLSTAETRS
jgi:hypothetical protein